MRQESRRTRCFGQELDRLHRCPDAIACGGIQACAERWPDALVTLLRELQVLEHGVLLEHRGLLKLAADARGGDFGFGKAREIDGLPEKRGARIRPGLAGTTGHTRR